MPRLQLRPPQLSQASNTRKAVTTSQATAGDEGEGLQRGKAPDEAQALLGNVKFSNSQRCEVLQLWHWVETNEGAIGSK
jgi:hypothetical protein